MLASPVKTRLEVTLSRLSSVRDTEKSLDACDCAELSFEANMSFTLLLPHSTMSLNALASKMGFNLNVLLCCIILFAILSLQQT